MTIYCLTLGTCSSTQQEAGGLEGATGSVPSLCHSNVTGVASPSGSAFEYCGPRSFRVRELGFIKANKVNMKKNTENHRK